MDLDGVIEIFGRDGIGGWAAAVVDGKFAPAVVHLRLKSYGVLQPTEYRPREEGRTGYYFRLPDELKKAPWSTFIDEFQAVNAEAASDKGAGEFRLPFFKSAFAPYDIENPTTIKAARLKAYSAEPRPEGRIAAFTIAYNEHLILPLWARYYAEHFGAENLFVIDQGSGEPEYRTLLPAGVNVIRVPRDMFDNWLIERLVATLQRFLLESYDSVLYTDSDEFVCIDPEVAQGASLRKALLDLKEPIGITTGYDLVHEIESEPPYDPARPVLAQRRFMHRMPTMDKPVISRVPLNWVPGFHTAAEGGTRIPGLYLLHLRWFDQGFALHKGGLYRASAWNQFDVEARLAEYQREAAEVIETRFRAMAANVRPLASSYFDPDANLTVVPHWMKRIIEI